MGAEVVMNPGKQKFHILIALSFGLCMEIALADNNIDFDSNMHTNLFPPMHTTLIPPISHTSNIFVDATGRTVILHGANIMNKSAPYYYPSFYSSDGNGSTLGEDWAKFFADNGFNVARVGIFWEAVEPTPGVYDDSYILKIRDMTRMFAKYGVLVILDFHQDGWSDQNIPGLLPNNNFGGEGFPAWASNYNLNGVAQPNNTDGYPFNLFSSPALRTVWDNFWHNVPATPDKMGVQDRYINMRVHVATLFKDEINLLYYGSISEPSVDIQTWTSLGQPGLLDWVSNSTLYPPNILSQNSNSKFFKTLFYNFHEKLNAAIRKVDGNHMIGNERTFYEVAGDHIPVVPKPSDKNIVLARSSYHTEDAPPQSASDYLQSPLIAKNNNMGFMAQEWGSSGEGDGTFNGYPPVMRFFDTNKISWLFWDFSQYPMTFPVQDQTFDASNSVATWNNLISPSTIAWSSTVGNPGGSMSVSFTSDPPNQPNGVQIAQNFNAGDLSAAGRMISMDVMVTTNSVDACGQPNPCFSTYMILVTNNGPNFDFVPQLQGSLIADGQWHHFSGPILPDGSSPLNDVRQLTLAFFGTPAGSEQVYVDNIQITGDPLQPIGLEAIFDNTTIPPTGNNVNNPVVNIITEPYPRVIAGTPLNYGYDPASNTMTLSYSKNGANGSEVPFIFPTEIAVPVRNYPLGYNAKVTGGFVISPANSPQLLMIRNPNASTVSVTITSK